FLVHPGLEAGFEVALDHALAVVVENTAVGEAAEQRLAHTGRIDRTLARKVERFGHRRHAHTSEDLVAGLGHLAGTRLAHPGDAFAHGLEGWPHRVESRGLAADHDGQRAGDSAHLAARDRR